MQINITGKNIELTNALKTHATEKMQTLTKHGHDIHHAHIIFAVENLTHLVEATLTIKGAEIHAKAAESDMYKAIDVMIHRLVAQLDKHKQKIIAEHQR